VDAQALLEKIKERGLILFGTGFVAQTCYRILQDKGLTDCLRCCVETRHTAESFHNVPVFDLAALPPLEQGGPILCVAVHEAVLGQVLPALQAACPGEIVWVYPYLVRWAYGEPIDRREIPVAEILAAQPAENYWITVRYAALREHRAREGPAPAGVAAGIYLRTQAQFSTPATARERLQRFCRYADEVARTGWSGVPPILLDEDYRVIDGLHRLAMAACLGRERIACTLVRASALYGDLLGAENRITPAVQKRIGLSEREMAFLRAMRADLLRT